MQGSNIKKAVISGITGQDGYYLAKFLLGKGYKVYGILRENQLPDFKTIRLSELSSSLVLIKVDLLNAKKVENLISMYRPDEVYHLAAISSVSYSLKNPHEVFQFNVMANLNLLEAIRLVDNKIKFFHAASSEIYGNVPSVNLPISELTPFNPNSPYALSKVSAYMSTVNYRNLYNLYATNGILFNHESPLRPDHFVFKKIINVAARISLGEKTKLTLGNVEIWRDWGFAEDYVEGMWLCLQHGMADDFIFSTGQCIQLKSIVSKVFSAVGLDYEDHLEIAETYFRKNDVLKNFGSSKKAKDLLGWKAVTNIDKLIQLLLEAEIKSLSQKK